jgi:ectoine hydroxylase-related dioxygenase (phytanoyl-CoA dioxygenase family)
MASVSLTADERAAWDERGFVIRRGAVDLDACRAMLERVVEISRAEAAGGKDGDALVLPERHLRDAPAAAEDGVSKIFRLHRDPVFVSVANGAAILDPVTDLLGDDLDCFLSQFIFKNPGAYGQPWHQDSFYFPFDTPGGAHQIGAWVAVTEATLENGCLWVLPGSHAEPVHEHIPDRRPDAQLGYVEIVDHDMGAEEPVLMDAGDLLLFDSHLMHRSTDNESDGIRAAMVFHYTPAGTVDRSENRFGVHDFVQAVRASNDASASTDAPSSGSPST